MEFKCFECCEEFPEEKVVVKHMKIIHFIKDNKTSIFCLKNNGCREQFSTFRNLKSHMKSCVIKVQELYIERICFELNVILIFSSRKRLFLL